MRLSHKNVKLREEGMEAPCDKWKGNEKLRLVARRHIFYDFEGKLRLMTCLWGRKIDFSYRNEFYELETISNFNMPLVSHQKFLFLENFFSSLAERKINTLKSKSLTQFLLALPPRS